MRRFTPCLLIFLVTVVHACTDGDRWKMAAEIEQSLLRTDFPADTFDITGYGAVRDDSSFLNTGAIEAAILKAISLESTS